MPFRHKHLSLRAVLQFYPGHFSKARNRTVVEVIFPYTNQNMAFPFHLSYFYKKRNDAERYNEIRRVSHLILTDRSTLSFDLKNYKQYKTCEHCWSHTEV